MFSLKSNSGPTPCYQRFPSDNSFSMYYVACISSISRRLLVDLPVSDGELDKPTLQRNTRDTADFVKDLPERNLRQQGCDPELETKRFDISVFNAVI